MSELRAGYAPEFPGDGIIINLPITGLEIKDDLLVRNALQMVTLLTNS